MSMWTIFLNMQVTYHFWNTISEIYKKEYTMVLPQKRDVGIIRCRETPFARVWSGKTPRVLVQNDALSAGVIGSAPRSAS